MKQIIAATIDDVPELSVLINSAYRGKTAKQGWTTEADLIDGTRTDENGLTEILRDPEATILKYVENQKILACVELIREDDKLYLGMLTVSPVLQGKGIGKELLHSAEQEALKQNCNSIFMTVISVRTELIDWYVRHGYTNTGKRKPFLTSHPRLGQPRQQLEFIVLEKKIK
ncbi:MAG TPA: GNAT family N-acetyltransferase [Chryseolinea sp.]|nr:GNAT family N-acetyltransferase [Chryseolinea sp.]HPH45702.1 GNAT family N-acetyltransferase [Chryseolinea sp.]HPM29302.1 GNAT family N-acetyltransferase [Chryseolinea sp.]